MPTLAWQSIYQTQVYQIDSAWSMNQGSAMKWYPVYHSAVTVKRSLKIQNFSKTVDTRLHLNIKNVFPNMGIPMLKIRQLRGRLIFNMGIPTLVRWHLYIEPSHRVIFIWSLILGASWSSWIKSMTWDEVMIHGVGHTNKLLIYSKFT